MRFFFLLLIIIQLTMAFAAEKESPLKGRAFANKVGMTDHASTTDPLKVIENIEKTYLAGHAHLDEKSILDYMSFGRILDDTSEGYIPIPQAGLYDVSKEDATKQECIKIFRVLLLASKKASHWENNLSNLGYELTNADHPENIQSQIKAVLNLGEAAQAITSHNKANDINNFQDIWEFDPHLVWNDLIEEEKAFLESAKKRLGTDSSLEIKPFIETPLQENFQAFNVNDYANLSSDERRTIKHLKILPEETPFIYKSSNRSKEWQASRILNEALGNYWWMDDLRFVESIDISGTDYTLYTQSGGGLKIPNLKFLDMSSTLFPEFDYLSEYRNLNTLIANDIGRKAVTEEEKKRIDQLYGDSYIRQEVLKKGILRETDCKHITKIKRLKKLSVKNMFINLHGRRILKEGLSPSCIIEMDEWPSQPK